MRVLEQRFLFDGAALIDPVWLAEVSSHSATSLVVVPEIQVAVAIQSHVDSTLGMQTNTNVNNERNTDAVINTETTDSSVDARASIEENLVPPKQLGFGVLPNAIKIAEATELTTKKLTTFANSAEFFSEITRRFGNLETDADTWAKLVFELKETLTQSGLGMRLDVLPNSVMNGALGAYTIDAGDGLETIYLNAEWLEHLSSIEDLVAVQIEEMGHAIDHRLNGLLDSPGDEGEALSDYLLPKNHPVLLDSSENDHAILIINGASIDVECATPTLSANTNLVYLENAASIVVNPSITVADTDGLLKTATITVSSFQAGDTLSFTPITSGNPVNRTGPIAIKDNVHGVMTLWAGSADSTATVQQWQNALRAVRYSSLSDDPTVNDTALSRSIGFMVNDGTSTSNVISSTVNITAINDAPIATVIPSNPTFSEGAGSMQGAAVSLFSAASLSTVESGQSIIGLTFTARQMLDGVDERIVVDGTSIPLNVANTYTTYSGYAAMVILGSGANTGTTTVTLGMESGIATSAAESLIKGIAFQNTKVDDPTQGNRVFTLIQLKDSGGTASNGLDTTTFNLVSTVNVAAVNDAPLAFADVATAAEAGGSDNAIVGIDPSGNVLTNDTDVDQGDTKVVAALAGGTLGSATAGSFGWLTLTGDGNYTYTADNNNLTVQSLRTATDTLTDTFTYTVRDSAGLVSSNTLAVTIHGMNDVPVITSITTPSLVVDGSNNETSFTAVVGTIAADDVDGTVSYAVETGTDATGSSQQCSYGTLTISGNAFSYAPDVTRVNALAEGSNPTDSFTVVVTDDSGVAVRQTLTFTLAGTNDAPIVIAAPALVLDEGDPLLTIDLLDKSSDADSDSLYVTDIAVSANGFVVSAASVGLSVNGSSLTLSPGAPIFEQLPANESIEITIRYQVSDGGIPVSATRIFTVTGVNDVAIVTPALPSVASVQEDTTLTASGVLTVSDADAGEQGFRGTAPDKPLPGKYGTLSITSAGLWVYTLNNNLAVVQNLNDGESLNDEQFTLTTIDGTGIVQLKLSVKGQSDFILPLLAPSASLLSGATGADMASMLVLAPALPEKPAPSSSSSFRTTVNAASGRLSGGPLMGALGLSFLGEGNDSAVAGLNLAAPGDGQGAAVVNDTGTVPAGVAKGAAANDGLEPAGTTPSSDQGASLDVNQNVNQGDNTIPEVGRTPAYGEGDVPPNSRLPLKDQSAALPDKKLAAVHKTGPDTKRHFRQPFSDQVRTALLGRSSIR
jgi:VCBS repeat-containing protein